MFHELEVFFLLAYFLFETAHISLCIDVLEIPYTVHVNISSGRKSAGILQRPLCLPRLLVHFLAFENF